ncbi:MAG: hypothetical protein ACOX7I_04180 [Oscillospiraceae bacterium]|jgi:hypothetical protein
MTLKKTVLKTTDNVSLVYKKDGCSDEDLEKIRSWARLVDSELQKAV